MIPIIPTNRRSRSLHRKRSSTRKLLLLPAAACALIALSSCSDESAKQVSPVSVTDTKPVGEGLKVIGFAVIGAAVVIVLGKMIRE